VTPFFIFAFIFGRPQFYGLGGNGSRRDVGQQLALKATSMFPRLRALAFLTSSRVPYRLYLKRVRLSVWLVVWLKKRQRAPNSS
jgi:hypothetical protein